MQYCFARRASVVVVYNTPRHNIAHQGAARGGPVVLRPVRATPCCSSPARHKINEHGSYKKRAENSQREVRYLKRRSTIAKTTDGIPFTHFLYTSSDSMHDSATRTQSHSETRALHVLLAQQLLLLRPLLRCELTARCMGLPRALLTVWMQHWSNQVTGMRLLRPPPGKCFCASSRHCN